MRKLLELFCILAAIYCFYFPFTYFNSDSDKKEVKITHILVETEDRAKELKQEILDKKYLFGDAAKQFSKCPSAEQRGDIGYNGRDDILKEISDIAFSSKKHVISEPIKTSEGWHLVKVNDIKYFSDKENFVRRY
ncbi:peptidyl-prolyl cis-trans isomerase [bacterium]|nr:peptidyl-prolyl cis-trans isomerase [bacterium]